jgi:hypothetical protein
MRASVALTCAALLATSATGCLITDSPQFQVPGHTAPFLVAASALPDLRNVVVVDSSMLLASTSFPFSADVISQDDPAGSNSDFTQVKSLLYIDYGFNEVPGLPYRYVFPGTTLTQPGTLDQTSVRNVSASWLPDVSSVAPGCHTATLVASHVFVMSGNLPECPACNDDFSTLTWLVLACDRSTDPSSCDDLPTMMGECLPPPLTSCATALADSDAGAACPESADAGTF